MNNKTFESEFFTFTSSYNLSLITKFHNEVKRNFQNEIVWMNEKLGEGQSLSDHEMSKLKATKETYINTFEPYLKTNTFLMMFSHLEEWLYHIWKRHAPNTKLDEAKGGIARFKPVLKELGIDLSSSGSWQFVKSCQDIRSCLLHANGRISLNRKPDKVRNLVEQHGDKIQVKSDRLVLSEEFLNCLQDAVEELIKSVGF